jgi:Uma2 family endonuclease
MSTILKFGPADHGRPVSEEELAGAHYQEGYCYEVIEGRLYVSPVPNMPHDDVVLWIVRLLEGYTGEHLDVAYQVSQRARVFVPDHPELTAPEPDLALYNDWPQGQPRRQLRWEDHTPILVVEVVSEEDPDKDLVRNVELYRLVRGIHEYWIFDPRQDPDHPSLRVYRRRGSRWRTPLDIATGGEYTTALLPGFRLTLE